MTIVNAHTVLIADDDDLLISLLEFKLQRSGFVTACVSNGEAALDYLSVAKPSVAILDTMMPRVDGLEVLRRLKANPATMTIPVVMLTALRKESDIVSALRSGAADYLSKPFNPDELVLRLHRVIATSLRPFYSAVA